MADEKPSEKPSVITGGAKPSGAEFPGQCEVPGCKSSHVDNGQPYFCPVHPSR